MAADDPTPDSDPVPMPDPPKATDEPIKPDEDWKARSRQHEREAKKERKAREDLEAKLAEYDNTSKSEHEKALEKARKEATEAARAEVASEYQSKVLQAEIRAQAAGKFANPALAVRLLDLDATDAFGKDGEVDVTAIASAIDEFLEADGNEGLRAGSSNPGRPVGSVDAGKGSAAAESPEDAHQKFIAGVLPGRPQ